MARADGAVAVLPGTDLVRYSRVLHQAHDAVMSGAASPTPLRGVVSRSWSRVLGFGLDPSRHNAREHVPRDEVERRRADSPLGLVVDELRAVLSSVADASHFISVVIDADGVILWREGAPKVLSRADSLGFEKGAAWTEDHVGTNAIGTALAERAPVQLFAAEHFELDQHPWYCTAAPVHDPRTGALLGVVDISGPALTLHPAIGALIQTATRLAEVRLWQHHRLRLDRLRAGAEHLLATSSGPLLVVDDDGWVAHQSGVPGRDRIAAPADGLPLAVPGLGLCVPERIPGGWLIRRSGARQAVSAHLTVDAVLEVRSSAERHWRTRLSPRHADILRALRHADPSGLTAAALSQRLFGDGDHQVTVRAEISRLRRLVGPLVTTAPYRIDSDVQLTVE